MSLGRRTPISIEMKLEVLEALKTKSKMDVAREFSIGYSTVKKINQNQFEILNKMNKSENLLRIRDRKSPNEEVGDAVVTWFHQMKAQDITVNGPIMLDKAKEIASSMGYEDFKPSHGWLERLKARNNIRFMKPSSKQGRLSTNKAKNSTKQFELSTNKASNSATHSSNPVGDDWIKNVLPSMIDRYDPNDVFNAAESALFYKAAPSILTGNRVQSGITSTDRLTVLYMCNATGSEKMAYVIGKLSCPPCFEEEGTPLPYYSSNNALMTDWIWRDILQKLNQSLENRNIILFVNNAACHKIKMELKNIKIVFLPKIPSVIQPLDRGIIRSVKINYRAQLLKKLISVLNDGIMASDFAKTIDLLQALRMFETAWFSISPTMVVDCFQKAGFYTDDVYCLEPEVSNEAIELKEILQDDFESFVECDKEVECFENTDSKMAAAVPEKQEMVPANDCDIDNTIPRVSHEEALDALSIVRRYLDENFEQYNAYYEVEEMIRLNAYNNSGSENEIMKSFELDC